MTDRFTFTTSPLPSKERLVYNYGGIPLHPTTAYIHLQARYVKICGWNSYSKWNKRPMGHIAHLRKQFKSITTYDYIMMLNKRRKKKPIINFMRINWFFIWTNLNPLHPRMLCAKFGWNKTNGSGKQDFKSHLTSVFSLQYFICQEKPMNPHTPFPIIKTELCI